MAQPKNVQAVLDWYRKHRPDMLPKIEQIVSSTHTEGFMAAALALLLQGFEAGREFEQEHPEIESGAGYLPDFVPAKVPKVSPREIAETIVWNVVGGSLDGTVQKDRWVSAISQAIKDSWVGRLL